MTLIAVMAIMVLFAIALLAAAPSVQLDVQREKELESIRRGEEIADAIRQYVTFYNGTKLPQSMDDLLEGLPQGTRKRMILRASAATDPLSPDGKWRLIQAEPKVIAAFAKRIQNYNHGLLPPNPTPLLDRYSLVLVNTLNTGTEDLDADDDLDGEVQTEGVPFVGVGSQSHSRSVLAYYGIENHYKWIFTPLFRGGGSFRGGIFPVAPNPPTPPTPPSR